jgi:hypothetical protein
VCDAPSSPSSIMLLITATGRSEMAQFFRPSLDQIQKGLKLVFEESEGAARVCDPPCGRE